MNNTDIRTGDRVLCKVGDFPPWPAVVVPQRFLSKLVYSGKRSKNYVCVAFFNDDSYYWKEPRHLTLLTNKMCTDWMKKNSKSRDNALMGAYKHAIEYQALFEFLKERLIQEERDDILEDVKDIPAGEDPFEPKPNPRRAGSNNNNNKPSNSKKRTKPSSTGDDTGSSSPNLDNKLETSNDEKLSYSTLPSVSSSPSLSGSSSSKAGHKNKRRKLDYDNRVSIAQLLRNKLQRNLVQRNEPPSEKEYKESDRLFKTIINRLSTEPPFFDYKALRTSKLYKLLKVITHDNNLARYHEDCKIILAKWSPIILLIKQDKQRSQQLEKKLITGDTNGLEIKVEDNSVRTHPSIGK
ncbi:Pdp3p Ecym_2802 [Eremothecium cymbalariae DBVPG|uniref:PWWP domain-containing protein n=1 Tax=Eremothecium cymbalariae (strain CBS 270.75 / DBVPG 7215 / KCTC 17166 / NRRL Y-17582) TaxID=931890 RepID=G8JQD6_ERECY|nr:Hypothetical protein Ecym_2802 [Eremothecium cymbalariae DBVPG\